MPDVTVTFVGLDKLIDLVDRAIVRAGDDTDLLSRGIDAYYAEAAKRFSIGQGVWQPLSAMRVAERGGRTGPILIDTGDLYAAATGGIGSGFGSNSATLGAPNGSTSPFGQQNGTAIMGWKAVGKKTATMGLRGDKVLHNQPGGYSTPRGHVPQREFWGWDSSPGGEVDLFFEPFEKWWDGWLSSP